MTASVVHGLRRKLRDGVVERTDAASTAATSRAAAVTSGPKMAPSPRWLGRGDARDMPGTSKYPPLQSFERAHDCLIISATVGMAVAAHCDGRH